MRIARFACLLVSLTCSATALAQEDKQTFRGDDVKGTQIRMMSPWPNITTQAFRIPLLDEFWFRFSENHHLLVIAARPQNPAQNQLMVSFKDDGSGLFGGGDKKYSYQTSVVWRQFPGATRGFKELVGCTSNPASCTVPADRPAPDSVFVLTGFQINYHGDDHHVRGLEVRENDGLLTVRLLDDKDQIYGFHVDYVWVPSSQIVQTGTASGEGPMEGMDGVRVPIPAGTSVLRGFALQFKNGAKHVREIYVGTPAEKSAVEAAFNDGGRNAFQYEIRWALVRQGGLVVNPDP